jgi:hypothetical protein
MSIDESQYHTFSEALILTRFAVEGSDEELVAERQERLESSGVITLTLRRVLAIVRQVAKGRKRELLPLGPMSEKAMKGHVRSHQVK